MKKFHVVNYHITKSCNFHCTYCFGKFEAQKEPSLDEAKQIIKKIASYFEQSEITNGRINFAGGEPTLYKHLDELIDYTSSLGIKVSIITNGFLLTPERIRSWKGKVSCIGVSIDSLDCATNIKIGRHFQNNVIEPAHWLELSQAIRECNIVLKINTVVSRLNINEDLSSLYNALKPEKIKLFQMHLIDGINDIAKPHEITEYEFDSFCRRHKGFSTITVAEPCGSMENSYLMINPDGRLQINDNGTYKTFGDLNTMSLTEILKTVPLDYGKFVSRYEREELI